MAEMSDLYAIWVFNGEQSRFPSGLFSTKELAEDWISKNKLSGVLTRYPVDVSVYDWAITRNFFEPKKAEHRESTFIGRFSSASQEHYHYEDGLRGDQIAGGLH